MKIEYYKTYSSYLNRDMEFKVYGHSGVPMLVFPCQDGRFFDYEDQGMINTISSFIDSGRLQVFCVDSIDKETWSANYLPNRERTEKQEAYYNYICEECVPMIFDINTNSNNGYRQKIYTYGCSMGASHALNFCLRRPDIFAGCIALSGVYDMTYFFSDGYMDELLYANSPIAYINGMSNDHYYVDMYRNQNIIICVGQGAWEHPMIEDTTRMKELFGYKGINAWVDFWGFDVCHDWPWWKIQIVYFLDKIC